MKMWNPEIFQIFSWRQKVSLLMKKSDCSLFDRIMISWYIMIWIRAKKICSLFDRIMIWIRAKGKVQRKFGDRPISSGWHYSPTISGVFCSTDSFRFKKLSQGHFPQVTLHEKHLSARVSLEINWYKTCIKILTRGSDFDSIWYPQYSLKKKHILRKKHILWKRKSRENDLSEKPPVREFEWTIFQKPFKNKCISQISSCLIQQ